MEKLFNLKNKVIVVTGAAGFLGYKHCEAILKFNGVPILLDIDMNNLKIVSNKLKKKFKKIINYYGVDISDEKALSDTAKKILFKFKKIDALINNASNNPQQNSNINNHLEDFAIDDWHNDLRVGLTGSFLCAKIFGKAISQNKKGGVIINISSDLGLIGPNQSIYKRKRFENQYVKPISYSVVKSGLIGMTRYLATYWSDKNVRSNAICPGGVFNNQDKEFVERIEKLIPLGRMADKNEFQGILIWMLSDSSSYLNGAVIPIDGGRTSW